MKVNSQNIQYNETNMTSSYDYTHNQVDTDQNGNVTVNPVHTKYEFRTSTKQPKLGIMLVGWGGNNGTTFTGGITANKHNIKWFNRRGEQTPNYYGSITQASTAKIGVKGSEEIYMPMNQILPTADPNNVVISGWDISSMNLGDAMMRAQVLDYDLIQKLYPRLKTCVPLPSIYYEDFLATNQKERADNILPGENKWEHLETIRKNIRDFKEAHQLDKIIVLWTASTERFTEKQEGIHDTAENIIKAVKNNHPEISPSTIFALATIMEGYSYINGSPQNTILPGVIELARQKGVFVVGDDFKSGQTKIKTSLIEFLVSAGIKPKSIVSYNHLGNNDGQNLSEQKTFRSKELSKKSCVDDILASNKVLYPESSKIDHEIIIKYVPYTQDTKKAMDEYCSEIFLGGNHTLVLYNVCEDSLLAAPIILDLILITEIFERIEYRIITEGDKNPEFRRFDNVLSTLGYLCKAPLTDPSTPLINSLSRQKNALDNIFKICAGIKPDDNLLLEYRCPAQSN